MPGTSATLHHAPSGAVTTPVESPAGHSAHSLSDQVEAAVTVLSFTSGILLQLDVYKPFWRTDLCLACLWPSQSFKLSMTVGNSQSPLDH